MRIKRITVKKFKNLVDFDCEFSDSNISAFIGNNGAGKSHLLELITRAFSNALNYNNKRDLPLLIPGQEPSVQDCIINYELDGVIYQLKYNHGIMDVIKDYTTDSRGIHEIIELFCGDKKIPQKRFAECLPSNILLYYAGETNRQKTTAEDTFDSRYDNKLKNAESTALPGLKYMDYYSVDDLPLLLTALVVYKSEVYAKLLERLNYKSISNKIHLYLGSPDPKKKSGDANNFWNTRGFIKLFLEEIRKYATSTKDLGFQYMMSFHSPDELKRCSDNEFDLFSKLKALKNYGILKAIGIRLVNEDGKEFSQLNLSEGEKQLSLLYLLTSFTAENNSLYLFDEFDAYLHLNWQRSVSKMLNDIDVNGHIIFTTHSPGTISQIKSDNLYIMKSGSIIYPESETYNRALDEIMLEQMNVSMRSDDVEKLYDQFKQSIADGNREQAERLVQELQRVLDKDDPIFNKIRINMRRI